MLLALLLIAAMGDWVPARWSSSAPETLGLLEATPINCVLVEPSAWSREFAAAAKERGVATLGVIDPGADASNAVAEAGDLDLTGVVLEGNFGPGGAETLRDEARELGLQVVELSPRVFLDLDTTDPVIGTYQGVWAGIHTLDDGTAKAAPTGAPWIDTNTGLIRFVRAASDATFWIGNRPPDGTVIPDARYLQAVGDAAMAGARWIVAIDPHFEERLFAGEAEALAAWKRIGAHLQFWEKHRGWTLLKPCGQLAVVQGADAGALLSNGILDMVSARHVPLRVVPPPKLQAPMIDGARIALNIDPPALSEAQQDTLKSFARSGGTLLTAPPGWTFPKQRPDQVTVDEGDVERLEDMWHGVNMTVGRENLGVRLFNVASMRSELVSDSESGNQILHLVNYSDYPVENITVRPQIHPRKATLYSPERPPQDLEIFENGEVDLPEVGAAAILVLELSGESTPASQTPGNHEHGSGQRAATLAFLIPAA